MGGRWALPARDRVPAARTLSNTKEIETKEMKMVAAGLPMDSIMEECLLLLPAGFFVDQSEKFFEKEHKRRFPSGGSQFQLSSKCSAQLF